MGNKKRVPALRFPGFEGEWDSTPLGEQAVKVGSGSTPRGGQDIYQDNGIIFIRSQNVNYNRLVLDEIVFIPEHVHKTMKGSLVKPLDILLNITGASLGRSCVVPESFKEGNVNQHVCIIRLNTDNDPHFFQHYLSSSRGQRLMVEGQTGSGREGLNFQSIRQFKTYRPSVTEQEKVASFLSSVGDKIQQLQKKISLLEQYKKGVMHRIFGQKIRFKDQNGKDYPDWALSTIREIAEIKYGKDQKNIVDKGGVYPILGTGGEIGKTNRFLFNKPSVLLGRKGTIDKPRYIDTPFWTVDTLFYTDIFEQINPKWLYYKFCAINWVFYNEASGVPSLSASTIYEIKVTVPSLEEQTKIANFLSSIDDKINLVNKQLELTKQFKKGLLQQMFV